MSRPDRGEEPRRATLEHIDARGAPRARRANPLRWIRIARVLLLVAAASLACLVIVFLWVRRAPRARPGTSPTLAGQSADALQSIEKFEFTSTLSGKRAYTIVADRLTAVAGGLHTVEGVRSIELVKPNGKILKGSGDHGSFQEGAGTGSGRAKEGIVLEGHVVVDGEEGEHFESERLEYIQSEKRLISPGPCRFRLAPAEGVTAGIEEASGDAGRLEYDLVNKDVFLAQGVRLVTMEPHEPDTIVHSETAEATALGRNALFHGSVRMERGQDTLAAPDVRIDRSSDGSTVHMVAGPHAEGRIAPDNGGRPLRFAADQLDGTKSGPSMGVLRLVGSASLQEEEGPGGEPGRAVRAAAISLQGRGPAQPRSVHAQGDVVVVFPPAPGEASARRMTCRILDAVTATGPKGGLESAEGSGNVRIQAGGATATAERAKLIGDNRVELRQGRPRVEEPDRALTADEIDMVSSPRQLLGRGAVRTRFVPSSAQAGPFTPDEPVDITSNTAALRDAPRSADFTGKVLARQADRALTSESLSLDEAKGTAQGEGSVGLRTFRTEASPAHDAPAAMVRIPVQINADRFIYTDSTKTTRFEGHAVYREPGRRLSADVITSTGGSPERPAQTIAEGHVSFEGEGKIGSADRAVYQSAQKTIVLEGTQKPAEVREPASGRSWRGPALTCLLTADSIPVVSGEAGRSKIIGTTAGPAREQVGKPTHRRKSR